MARITMEDSLRRIKNRFQLCLVATYRARQLYNGSEPLVSCKNKPPVIALREIAEGKVGLELLEKETKT